MAEDGRPSGRGHPGKGCFAGLFLIPLVLLRVLFADLYPTPTRLALLQDIADGLVYKDPYDTSPRYEVASPHRNVTARVKELIGAGWAVQRSEPGDMWRKQIRLTASGEQILKGDRR